MISPLGQNKQLLASPPKIIFSQCTSPYWPVRQKSHSQARHAKFRAASMKTQNENPEDYPDASNPILDVLRVITEHTYLLPFTYKLGLSPDQIKLARDAHRIKSEAYFKDVIIRTNADSETVNPRQYDWYSEKELRAERSKIRRVMLLMHFGNVGDLLDPTKALIYLLVHNSPELTELYAGLGSKGLIRTASEFATIRKNGTHSNGPLRDTVKDRAIAVRDERVNTQKKPANITPVEGSHDRRLSSGGITIRGYTHHISNLAYRLVARARLAGLAKKL